MAKILVWMWLLLRFVSVFYQEKSFEGKKTACLGLSFAVGLYQSSANRWYSDYALRSRFYRKNTSPAFALFARQNRRSFFLILILLGGDIGPNPGPAGHEALLWSINTCIHSPNYYSCGVDAVADMFYYSIFPYCNEYIQQNPDKNLTIDHLLDLCRQRSLCHSRQEWSLTRTGLWNYLCDNFESDFCPRGTIRASPDNFLGSLCSNRGFMINRKMVCTECRQPSSYDHALKLVYLSPVVLRSSEFNVERACNAQIETSFRKSSCCRATLKLDSFSDRFTFLALLLPFLEPNCMIANLVMKPFITLGSENFKLVGAIRSRNQHFSAIVSDSNEYHELDDLENTIFSNVDFCAVANRFEREMVGGNIIHRKSCIWFAIYVRCPNQISNDATSASIFGRRVDGFDDNQLSFDEKMETLMATVISEANEKLHNFPAKPFRKRKYTRRAKENTRKVQRRAKERKIANAISDVMGKISLINETVKSNCSIGEISDFSECIVIDNYLEESKVDLHNDKFHAQFEQQINPSLYICSSCDFCCFTEELSADCRCNIDSGVGAIICKLCAMSKRCRIENFDPGKWEVAPKLNFLEGRFLNLVNAYMTVIRLPGGQKGECGQVIHFPNNLEDIKLHLPVNAAEADVLVLDSSLSEGSHNTSSYIRVKLLHYCYSWLRKNNPLFSDFRIDTLPFFFARQGLSNSVMMNLPPLVETGFIEDDYTAIDVDQIIDAIDLTNSVPFSVPKTCKKPVTYFGKQKLEEKCFVTLFPFGNNGFDEPRSKYITLQAYFKRRLLSGDSRFRLHQSYLFWAVNLLEQNRLQQRISVALKTKHLTDEKVNNIELEKILRNKSYSFVQSIRGSVGYWMNVLMNLLAKVATLGPPTWFLTLSADDMGWSDYKQLLRKDCGNDDHFKNVISNPVMCAKQFQMRWYSIRRYIKQSKVLSEVTDAFERVEFQNRGSPHLHIFLWVKDAPSLESAALPKYLDKYISTRMPNDVEDRAIVTKYQIHKHTGTCTKFGRTRCRFNFPRSVCTETKAVKGKFLGMKRYYETARGEGEEWINAYNMQLLRVFRANMDLQFVGDAYGVAMYVCAYLCKTEPLKFRNAIEKIIEDIHKFKDKLSARQILSKFGTAVLTKRCLSAQEAAFRILGIPLCYSTRKTIFVNCRPFCDRYRVLKSVSSDGFQEQIDDKDEIQMNVEFKPSLIDHYCQRPNTGEFEKMCLARFAAWYNINPPCNSSGTLTLLDGETKIVRRKKSACLRTVSFSEVDAPELFYYRLLILHLPFRSESSLIVPFSSYLEAFMRKKSQFDPFFYGIELFQRELESVIQKQRILRSTTLEDLVLELQLGKIDHSGDNVNITNGANMDSGFDMKPCSAYNEQLISELESDIEAKMFNLFTSEMSDKEFATSIGMLNREQANVFDYVKKFLSPFGGNSHGKPLRLFVSGSAGTGKSFLIKTISELVIRMCRVDSPAIVKAALTGVAARNIDGITLHRAFVLPVDHKFRASLFPLGAEVLQRLRRFYKNVNTLIIDEISMVSYRYFEFIHKRLCEIKGNELPFGGINVILFGDFCQLKPVMDSFVFTERKDLIHLFNDLFFKTKLTISMRQSGDSNFSEMLSRLRLGQHTQSDVDMLFTRYNAHVGNPSFENALRIFPTRDQVHEYNTIKLEQLEQSQRVGSLNVEALDKTRDPANVPANDDEAAGLPKRLKLLVNARVMLIRNISCDDGLTNGALGTIVAIERADCILASHVKVQFDNIDEVIAIDAISVKYMGKCNSLCERTQFPLALAWACTVHKVQGLTLKKAVIDVGRKIFQPAMAYVALSRVRTLNDLALSGLSPSKLTCFKGVKDYYRNLSDSLLINT